MKPHVCLPGRSMSVCRRAAIKIQKRQVRNKKKNETKRTRGPLYTRLKYDCSVFVCMYVCGVRVSESYEHVLADDRLYNRYLYFIFNMCTYDVYCIATYLRGRNTRMCCLCLTPKYKIKNLSSAKPFSCRLLLYQSESIYYLT